MGRPAAPGPAATAPAQPGQLRIRQVTVGTAVPTEGARSYLRVGRLRVLPDGPGLPDPRMFTRVRAVLGDPGLDDLAARQELGRLALEAPTVGEESHLAGVARLLGKADWPDRDLRITTTDARTGELRIWRRRDNIPLTVAVAASIALPGIWPPITIQRRRYIDGALRANASACLTDGTDVLVAVEPVGHYFGGPEAPAFVPAGRTALITPDADAMRFFTPAGGPGHAPDFPQLWIAAYTAGAQQASSAAALIGEIWNNPAH